MGNTLTSLAPTLFSAAQEVSNEPFNLVKSINTNFDNKGVAKGDTVTVQTTVARTASNFTPAATSTSGTDAVAGAITVEITKSRKVSWHLTGEQIRSLENGNESNYGPWVSNMMKEGMRTLRNEAEDEAFAYSYIGASRAYGTAATTPFASDLSALAQMRKILKDNGAPMADLQCVTDTAAYTNALNLGLINQAYAAGSDSERRTGIIGRQYGFQLGESASITTHTKGTATGFDANGGEPIGETTIVVDGSSSGTILAGDIVTWVGDTNKYVVASATASGGATGNIVINTPGLRETLADTVEGTIGDTYTANLCFERNAIVGVVRPPLVPDNPTISQMPISDQFGMTYLLLDIAQYGQRTWELHLAFGFKVVQPEHVAILLG